jgi:hypothetical protein
MSKKIKYITSTTICDPHVGHCAAVITAHTSPLHAGAVHTTAAGARAQPLLASAATACKNVPEDTTPPHEQSGGARPYPAGSGPTSRIPNPTPVNVTRVPPATGPSVGVVTETTVFM